MYVPCWRVLTYSGLGLCLVWSAGLICSDIIPTKKKTDLRVSIVSLRGYIKSLFWVVERRRSTTNMVK